MAEWQNGRICRPLISALVVPTYQTNLPHQWSCCRVFFCAAHSVWKARRARGRGRGRVGATPAQQNAHIIITPFQQRDCHQSFVTGPVQRRERQRERQSMAHIMAGKWRPFMRLRLQLLRRCFWGMMQGSLITEGGKERSSQGASKAYMLGKCPVTANKAWCTNFTTVLFFLFLSFFCLLFHRSVVIRSAFLGVARRETYLLLLFPPLIFIH